MGWCRTCTKRFPLHASVRHLHSVRKAPSKARDSPHGRSQGNTEPKRGGSGREAHRRTVQSIMVEEKLLRRRFQTATRNTTKSLGAMPGRRARTKAPMEHRIPPHLNSRRLLTNPYLMFVVDTLKRFREDGCTDRTALTRAATMWRTASAKVRGEYFRRSEENKRVQRAADRYKAIMRTSPRGIFIREKYSDVYRTIPSHVPARERGCIVFRILSHLWSELSAQEKSVYISSLMDERRKLSLQLTSHATENATHAPSSPWDKLQW